MNKLHVLVLIVCLVCCSGCGTLVQALSPEGPAVYGGLRMDGQLLSGVGRGDGTVVGLILLDLPLCLITDTLLLPISLPNEVAERGIETRFRWGRR